MGEGLRYDKKRKTENEGEPGDVFKKRMFRSNMKILFAALLSLMLIILTVLVLFEDILEKQVYAVSGMKVEQHAGEVARILAGNQDLETLYHSADSYGYQIALIADGKVLDGERSEQMSDLADFFAEEIPQSGGVDVFTYKKGHDCGKISSGSGCLSCGGVFSGG